MQIMTDNNKTGDDPLGEPMLFTTFEETIVYIIKIQTQFSQEMF